MKVAAFIAVLLLLLYGFAAFMLWDWIAPGCVIIVRIYSLNRELRFQILAMQQAKKTRTLSTR